MDSVERTNEELNAIKLLESEEWQSLPAVKNEEWQSLIAPVLPAFWDLLRLLQSSYIQSCVVCMVIMEQDGYV